jgi:hypothetical protein
MLKDQEKILSGEQYDFIESWCAPCLQGLRRLGETRVPFAEWLFPLHLSIEFENGAPHESCLSDLNFYRLVHMEDSGLTDFLFRSEDLFRIWREQGSWSLHHPWMEMLLPWDSSQEFIEGILKSFPPNLIAGGQIVLWPIHGDIADSPLFMHPGTGYVMGFGILPAVSRQYLEMTRSLINRASDLGILIGAKRYLSGWFEFDHEEWKDHFDHNWKKVIQLKMLCDPNRILNPDVVDYG